MPINRPLFRKIVRKPIVIYREGGGNVFDAPFDPLSLFTGGVQGVIYDLTNAATVFQERTGAAATTPSGANGAIGTLKDLSPNNNYCVAPSAAGSAVWRAAGYAESDGVDDALSVNFASNQPVTWIASFRPITTTLNKTLYSGPVNQSGLYCNNAGPPGQYFMFAASALVGPVLITAGEDVVVTEQFNGASSRIAKNNAVYTTGDPGADNPGGVCLFRNTISSLFADIRLYRIVMIARLLNDTEIAQCRTWCGAAAGIGL